MRGSVVAAKGSLSEACSSEEDGMGAGRTRARATDAQYTSRGTKVEIIITYCQM